MPVNLLLAFSRVSPCSSLHSWPIFLFSRVDCFPIIKAPSYLEIREIQIGISIYLMCTCSPFFIILKPSIYGENRREKAMIREEDADGYKEKNAVNPDDSKNREKS